MSLMFGLGIFLLYEAPARLSGEQEVRLWRWLEIRFVHFKSSIINRPDIGLSRDDFFFFQNLHSINKFPWYVQLAKKIKDQNIEWLAPV